MAEADAAREARLVAEAQARKALIAAEAEARDARRWRDQAQAHAAARLQADTMLSELLQSKTGRQETLEEERRTGRRQLSPPCRRCPGWRRSTASGGSWARSRTGCSRQGSAGSRA